MNDPGIPRDRLIDEAIAALALPASAIRRLDVEAAVAARAILETWFAGVAPWAFDPAVLAFDSWCAPDDEAYLHLQRLVPDPAAPVWFGSCEDGDLEIHAADIATVQRVLGECPYFDYFVADPQGRWLLVENHHGALIGVGDEVRARLRALAAEREKR